MNPSRTAREELPNCSPLVLLPHAEVAPAWQGMAARHHRIGEAKTNCMGEPSNFTGDKSQIAGGREATRSAKENSSGTAASGFSRWCASRGVDPCRWRRGDRHCWGRPPGARMQAALDPWSPVHLARGGSGRAMLGQGGGAVRVRDAWTAREGGQLVGAREGRPEICRFGATPVEALIVGGHGSEVCRRTCCCGWWGRLGGMGKQSGTALAGVRWRPMVASAGSTVGASLEPSRI